MIYLLLSVLSSSVIFVIFKLFERFKINTLQAIIFNYFFAFSAGMLVDRQPIDPLKVFSEDWFLGTFILGFMFIAVFYLAALTTQKSGLSVVSVATKMSVAIPVLFGIILYNESTGWIKIFGIILALVAVYLTSIKKKEGIKIKKRNLIFPLLVFFGSGIIDTTLKFLETSYVAEADVALFSSTIFAIAGIIGVCILIFQGIRGSLKLNFKNVIGGVALGIPNFGSIYFLVLALRTEGMESSTIFPLNNVAIVMISTFLGILLFKERMLPKNWIGILLAVASIILIATSEEWM
ncbi:EamA family transporter [Salinimicrobium sp. MT39]|uniref:EamA family transporter n=1 Tax=Salinimicrobium profundisediminis TaxID=2994553 RepID=A0A9X3CVH8_9FLAO|nr:EamA family transporter [Salinimicrobium profundisediminis]MCX2837611.1 EamA family transporter [Salinimicrobium profundisediminis]